MTNFVRGLCAFNTDSLTDFQEHFSTRASNQGGFNNSFSIGTYQNVLFYFDGGAFVGSTNFSPSTWYNVVTTNQSGTLTFYINANVEGTLNAIVPYLNPFVSLGAAQDGTELYNGQLDEIGVWNRALSLTEVSDLYNIGFGLTYPFGNTTGNGINTKYIYDLIKLPWFIRDGGKDSFISGMLKLPWFINI